MPDTLTTEEPLSAFEMPEPTTPPTAPVSNVPPRPSNPVLLPGMPTIESVSTDLFGADGKGGARGAEAAGYRAKAEGMQPLYAGVQSALDEQERVAQQRPTPPVLTAPPSRGLRDFLAVSENETPVASIAKLLQAMSLFTMSTVGASRHNAVGAMAAFAGAMKGWQEGDAQRADRDFADWDAKTHKALTDYKLQTDDYKNALTASGLSVEGRIRATQLKAMEFGDTQAALTAESGGLESLLGYLTKRDDTHTKTALAVQKMLDARGEAQRKQAADAETAKHHRALEANAAAKLAMEQGADASAAQFTPQALELAAQTYIQTGALPPMGMGKASTAARMQIMNRAAQIAESMGGVDGQAARNALYKANAAELVKLQSQRGPVLAFEKTAQGNLDLVESLAKEVDRSGKPLVNRWLLAGRKATGDPRVAALDAGIRVAINESAKVVSGASGGAVTSDTARKEIESMLNSAMTPEQLTSVIKVLRTDMANRVKGFDEQIRTTTDALKMKPDAKPETKGRDVLRRSDSRYSALRQRGMSDQDIMGKYGVDLGD